MAHHLPQACRVLSGVVLSVTLLAAQSQLRPPSGERPMPSGEQPMPSGEQQALDAFAEQLIAATTDEARNALLSANSALVTVELLRLLHNVRGINLLRAKTDLVRTRAIFDTALTIAERMHDRKWIALCLDKIGQVLRAQGDYEASLEYHHRAAVIFEELNDPAIAGSYNEIGIALHRQGHFREAEDYYKRALNLNEAQGNQADIAMASFNLGNVYHELGNERLAVEQYKRSLDLSQALGIQLGLAYNTNSLGNVFEAQGDYNLALSYYEQSLKLKEKTANQREIAQTLMNIALVSHKMGNEALAHQDLDRALMLKEAAGDKDGTALVLLNYGWVLREQGKYREALERDQASLSLSEAVGDTHLLSETLVEVALASNAQNDHGHAVESGRRASEMARHIGATKTLARALDVTAVALAALGQVDEAYAMFREAIGAIEDLRGQVAGAEEQHAQFLAHTVAPYQHLVELCLSQHKLEEALAVAEQAKARVLLDVMRSGRVTVVKAMSPAEREQERQLLNRLTSLSVQRSTEDAKPTPDRARVSQLDAALRQARLDYQAFQVTLYAAHPELQAERGDARPVSLGDTAAVLPDGKTALLEFVVADHTTHLFVLTKDTEAAPIVLTSYAVSIDEHALTERVSRFREQLATRDPRYGESARALYRQLLGPAHAVLAGKTTLVIVPDGVLWELPFQALQSSAGHHLLEDAAISYAPSLTVLCEMVRRQQPDSRRDAPRLLALGNPVPALAEAAAPRTPIAPNPRRSRIRALRGRPEDLPGAAREVAALGRLYGVQRSTIYTGRAASEHTLKAEAGRYDVLHLATHGIFDNRSPMYSHLVLSGGGADDDGLLEAWEVMNLDLKADLVVLSACETARGAASLGEGLIGMSWAFFVAGSPSLVASQWKVDSASTTDLMVRFHRGLHFRAGGQGPAMSKARALQQAALGVMKGPTYRHPFYWAGFVLVGNGF
jgi:CHAT domain-containing protein/Tfp pilus assembly protein PilF